MRTLALYCDDNGEGHSCIITHDAEFDLTSADLKPILPNFSDGGILFLIHGFVHDYADGNPTITNGYGEDVKAYAAGITGATITASNEIAKAASEEM